jgi:hypothetical protein
MGEWQRPRKVANWELVEKLCSDALKHKSKDLRIAVWLTEAMLRLKGYPGLKEGLDLLCGLIERFWDSMYPPLEDDGADYRAGQLEWIGSRLDVALKSVALTSSGLTWLQYDEWHRSGGESESAKAERRDDFYCAVQDTPPKFYRTKLDEIVSCSSALDHLESVCNKKFAPSTPDFSSLRSSFEIVRKTIETWHKMNIAEPCEASAEVTPTTEVPASGLPTPLPCEQQIQLDRLHFTLTAPAWAVPGSTVAVSVWGHLELQRDLILKRALQQYSKDAVLAFSKGPVPIRRGAVISVRLVIPGALVEDPEDSVLWVGEIGSANFLVTIPAESRGPTLPGSALIYFDGLTVAKLQFVLSVGPAVRDSLIQVPQVYIRRAFASYASADRDEVLARLQGIQKAAPGLNVFFDLVSLRSGQSWERELEKVIYASDIFYLFWSANARQSRHVESEWRIALGTGRAGFIDPVPLQPPEEAPPPLELAGLHFNDWMLAFMRRRPPIEIHPD